MLEQLGRFAEFLWDLISTVSTGSGRLLAIQFFLPFILCQPMNQDETHQD